MSTDDRYLLFRLDAQQHALPLAAVERLVQAVAVTPLPHAPALVLGVINVQGRVLPVVSARQLYGLAPRPVGVDDHFIIASTGRHTVVLVVDAVVGTVECRPDEVVAADTILPALPYVRGVGKTADGLILLHDPRRLLSPETADALGRALHTNGATPL